MLKMLCVKILKRMLLLKKLIFNPFLCALLLFLGIIWLEMNVFLVPSKEKNITIEDEFSICMDQVEKIFLDLQCFPVKKEFIEDDYPVVYENSWGEERNYGGERFHEGCDLMAKSNERGRYIVCSMTDGTVEKIGWLEPGGWRIGIKSDNGIYYYYAHLDSYEQAFKKGDRVTAGQILGRMGDSGYGKEPGTKGNFDVHLHIGIYATDSKGKERAVNPYWYLKQLEI